MREPSIAIAVLVPFLLLAPGRAQAWIPVPPAGGGKPQARANHAMAHDVLRRQTLLFGGFEGSFVGFADHREWDGVQWVTRSLPPPPARWGHGLAFDVGNARTVAFGGYMASYGPADDTWTFDGAAWSQRTPAQSPPPRLYTAMTYDSWRRRVVLFGGLDTAALPINDTWEWDGANWSLAASTTAPPGRAYPSLAFDDTRGEVVLFGGDANGQALGDTWTRSAGAWVQRVSATMPGPRTQAAMAHDSHAGVTVLFGGTDGAAGAYFGDTWLWDGASWAATSIAGMSPRYGCALVYDARKQETMAFGGRDASGYLSDQYVLPTTGRRGMAVVAPPQLGGQAQFRYLHPATAAGRVAILAVGGHETAEQQVPIPGLVSLGGPRFDVGALWAQFGFLSNAGGSVQLSLPVPADPALAGLAFDVQGLDLSLPDSVVYWASADAEVAVQAATPPVDLDMAAIPAGSVMMGSPIGNNNERPMHVAVLSQPFWMGRTEVTQAQYQAVMGSNPSAFQGPAYPGSERMPVETVSYQDALAYCASLTFTEAAAGRVPAGYQYRLPTEAEWEYCCRAGTTTEWHTGTSISFAFANYAGSLADAQNPNGRTWQVARYAPNAFGLHDMHGGLWEWCLDAWDGTPNYPSATVVDPYVTVGSSRVIRGGSWFSNINDFNIRSALRGSALSAVRNSRLGFRVVLAPALVP